MESYLNANHYREISIRFIPLNNKKIFFGLIYKSFKKLKIKMNLTIIYTIFPEKLSQLTNQLL